MPPLPPITQALLLINVGMWCLLQLFPVGGILALWPWDRGFLPWQVVTYGFLHIDFSHLFFNSLGIWMFGGELERLWGPKRYLQLYIASIITAGFSQLALAAITGSAAPTIGASGGLFGLLLGFGMMFPNRVIVPLIPPIPMKAKVFVAIFGGIELVLGLLRPGDGVAHFAHLGGMLGAFLMIQYWRGKPPFGRR